VKCPSCGSGGEREAILRAAGFVAPEEVATNPPVAPAPDVTETGGATRIAGSASRLNLPPGLRCTFTVLSGPGQGKKMTADRPRIVVGRNNGDFPLDDPEISREHCAFEITGVTCTVRDLESRNGTFVDGKRVTSQSLSTMSEVRVGNSTILFTMTLDEGTDEP
jgi:pSer/pThr/pTyr-binding forkhead associated (FHA) protein